MSASPSVAQLALGWQTPPHAESLDMRVARFLRESPDALRALVWLARQKVASDIAEGRKPAVGAKGIVERLRWRDFPKDAPDYVRTAPAPNNSYASRLGRIIAESHEDLAAVFEFRELDT